MEAEAHCTAYHWHTDGVADTEMCYQWLGKAGLAGNHG